MRSKRFLSALCFVLALQLTSSITANGAGTRSLSDRPDDLKGAQIHLIYLVPNDSADHNWDTSGQIKTWVDSGNNWLQTEIGRKLRFDLYQGELDISFLKSKYTIAQLQNTASTSEKSADLIGNLLKEFFALSPQTSAFLDSPKTYMFVTSEIINSNYCGLGYAYSGGIVWAGGICWSGPQDDSNFIYGMSPVSAAIIHESFHTYGVRHVCDSQADLMWGVPDCSGKKQAAREMLDFNKDDYYGAERAGTDVSKLTIWADGSGDSNYGRRKTEKTYGWYIDGKSIFTIGGNNQSISWDWSQGFSPNSGSYIQCLAQGVEGTIEGTGSGTSCKFAVPRNWRGGQYLTITAKIASGPYFGTASETIALLNPENNFSACTSKYCFAGRTEPLSISTCWTPAAAFELQRRVGSTWKTVGRSNAVRTKRCSNYFQPTPIEVTFKEVGSYTYRWLILDKLGKPTRTLPTQTLTILPANANYPTK